MSTIQLRTPIPGPRSQALMKRRNAAVVQAAYHATPVFVAKAEGAVVEDVDGNRLIDFAGGIGCLNTGHRAPAVVDAVRRQLDRFLHTSFNVLPYESYVAVCEKLNALVPGKGPKKTILVNTGAEAVENAIKIARCYTKKPAIISFEDAFHGRTYMAMAATSKTHPYKAGFEPFPSEVYRIPYAYCFRCSYSMTYPSCDVHCARHIEDTFKRVVAAESVAAVIVEPILGEGGFVTPPPEFYPTLAAICRKHGILLIADEVQTGFARTGAMFACERLGLEPDLVTMAKSLTGGLPMAAVTGRADIMDAPGVGQLGRHVREAILRPAKRRWPCSTSSKKKICARAPTCWASVFASVRRSGRRSGNWSAMSADLARCRRWNWCAQRRLANPLTKRPNKCHNTVTSMAW